MTSNSSRCCASSVPRCPCGLRRVLRGRAGADVGQLSNEPAIEVDREHVVVADEEDATAVGGEMWVSLVGDGLREPTNGARWEATRCTGRPATRRRASACRVRDRRSRAAAPTLSACASLTRSGAAPPAARTRYRCAGSRQSVPGGIPLEVDPLAVGAPLDALRFATVELGAAHDARNGEVERARRGRRGLGA